MLHADVQLYAVRVDVDLGADEGAPCRNDRACSRADRQGLGGVDARARVGMAMDHGPVVIL